MLLVFALILVIAQPRIQAWTRLRAEKAGHAHDHVTSTRMVLPVISTYLTGVYGGYFAAAHGIVLIATMRIQRPLRSQCLDLRIRTFRHLASYDSV